ncbi:hypothetical protein CBR_g23549 [Chara braunii]|uniref:Uncharacterized protein n=1 Tax=Chara braunii TaxID=69332 RepID=A0A388L4Q0_CHABU|nr:hypothetical protein CBR_g23549 [Chara braunii]|eukprot:GBG77222.1 hypothetical protein CBR_g23549 [Chara braunii]
MASSSNRTGRDGATSPAPKPVVILHERDFSGSGGSEKGGSSNPEAGSSLQDLDGVRGALYKRKDFLATDEAAKSHPNRTYYYRKNDDDVEKLIAVCTQKLETHAGNARALFIRASAYAKKGDLTAAIEDYTEIIRDDPANQDSLFQRGSVWEKLGNLDAAIDDFTKVLALNPANKKAALQRAACQNLKGNLGNLELAINDYELALKADEDKSSKVSSFLNRRARDGSSTAGGSGSRSSAAAASQTSSFGPTSASATLSRSRSKGRSQGGGAPSSSSSASISRQSSFTFTSPQSSTIATGRVQSSQPSSKDSAEAAAAGGGGGSQPSPVGPVLVDTNDFRTQSGRSLRKSEVRFDKREQRSAEVQLAASTGGGGGAVVAAGGDGGCAGSQMTAAAVAQRRSTSGLGPAVSGSEQEEEEREEDMKAAREHETSTHRLSNRMKELEDMGGDGLPFSPSSGRGGLVEGDGAGAAAVEGDRTQVIPSAGRSGSFTESQQRKNGHATEPSTSFSSTGMPITPPTATADFFHGRGFAHRKASNFLAAIEDYTRAIEKDPNHFKALFNRGFSWWVKRRMGGAWEDLQPADDATEEYFHDKLRISPRVFREITENLSPFLQRRVTFYREPLEPDHIVAYALYRWASGETYESSTCNFGIGRATGVVAVRDVTAALLAVYREKVSWLTGVRKAVVLRAFTDKGFLNCHDCIDCTHICIDKSANAPGEDYFDRK